MLSSPSANDSSEAKSDTDIRYENDSGLSDKSGHPDIYRGPSESLWRKRNEEEIQIAKALQQIRNEDLSIHLYNATKLLQNGLSTSRSSLKSEKRHFDAVWHPPKHWTAWPLLPADVPRERGYAPGDTLLRLPQPYINVPVRPSLQLEEVLVAQLLKLAKEKFSERPKEEFILKPLERRQQRRAIRDKSRTRSRRQSSASAAESTQDDQSEDEEIVNERKLRSSIEPDDLPQAHSSLPPWPRTQAWDLSIIEDDAQALEILQPHVRHILSQFDMLLSHLHLQRVAYAAVPPDRGESTDTNTTDDRSRSRGRQTRRPRKRAATPAPSSQRPDIADTDSEEDSRPSQSKRRNLSSRRERSRKRQWKLKLRDWEDVLTVATMTSLPAQVIQRTGERCKTLFASNHPHGHSEDQISWEALLQPMDASTSIGWIGLERNDQNPPQLPTKVPKVDFESFQTSAKKFADASPEKNGKE